MAFWVAAWYCVWLILQKDEAWLSSAGHSSMKDVSPRRQQHRETLSACAPSVLCAKTLSAYWINVVILWTVSFLFSTNLMKWLNQQLIDSTNEYDLRVHSLIRHSSVPESFVDQWILKKTHWWATVWQDCLLLWYMCIQQTASCCKYSLCTNKCMKHLQFPTLPGKYLAFF